MKKFLELLILKSSGISKTKITILVMGALNFCNELGFTQFSPDQITAFNTILTMLLGLFFRDAIESSGPAEQTFRRIQ